MGSIKWQLKLITKMNPVDLNEYTRLEPNMFIYLGNK